MKLSTIMFLAALVIGVGAAGTLFLVPAFQHWFFIFEMAVIGLIVTGVILRAQPPK